MSYYAAPPLKMCRIGNSAGHTPATVALEREAIFVYKFSGKLESPERPNVTVRWFGKTKVVRVEIEGDLIEHSD